MTRQILLLMSVLLLTLGSTAASEELHLTYLGNEGFLIEAGGHKVLIDALTAQDPTYVLKTEALQRQLLRAEPPFDDVGLVLTTHRHHDHFDPDAVSEYLLANPRARFISTPQAVERLRRAHPAWDVIRDRVDARYPATGERIAIDGLPFSLELLRLHHGLERRPSTENLGFLLDVGGWKVLHIGDTEATERDFAPYRLAEDEIDIALVPSWFFAREPWTGVIETSVAPRRLVAMHLAPDWHREARTANQRQARERVERIRRSHPQVLIFERELERRTFER